MRSQRSMRSNLTGPLRRPAFTLVELLVTIAIIAVLAALLLPVLGRAKESARATACRNNLHQLALASLTYSVDANGKLPSFRNWLFSNRAGDLTTGKLYPYLKSKQVYQCPTDALDLATGRKTGSAATTVFGGRTALRNYSYGMNCEICHATDLARFLEPSRTVLYMEGDMGPSDYSGLVGPAKSTPSLSFRHAKRGHMVMGDLHIETMDKKRFTEVAKAKRFWYPTDDTSGPGGMRFGP